MLLFCVLALLWFILCRDLSQEWSDNEQYSYGWFVPFFAAFLFWLRWEDRPCPGGTTAVSSQFSRQARDSARPSNLVAVAIALVILFPVRLFEIANPDWRPLSWAHALAVVCLTMLVLWSLGGKSWLRHFAFPVAFILVAVPWVTPIEAPIVQGLMRIVAAVATEALTLFGIPAQLEGSLIRVHSGVVGVSEACSGVRSLQTSLMIGLLFGELKRLTIPRRIVLVAAALAIALCANFGRAFFLVWIAATKNLAAVERWHDVAGYAIVLAVFLGTIAIAALLGRREGRPPGRPRSEEQNRALPSTPRPSTPLLAFGLCSLIAIEVGVEGWYRWHERNFIPTTSWSVRWPDSAPGFRTVPIDEDMQSTLRFNAGGEVAWQLPPRDSPNESASPPANCLMFFFRWEPGSASILRARAHRPDKCLPSSGWRVRDDNGVRSYPVTSDFALPFRHFRFVRHASTHGRMYAETFFCQAEDRVPRARTERSDSTGGRPGSWGIADRLRVVRDGLRNQGQEVLELVMITPNELSSEAAQANFAMLVPQLVVLKAETLKR